MPFSKLFQYLDPLKNTEGPRKDALLNKLYGAEKNLALLRILVIFLNAVVYHFLMEKTGTHTNIAYAVMAIAGSYCLLVYFFKPYKKYRVFLSSLFTSSTDALLISVWIYATGGFQSPFYVLWYISLIAIALRYSFRITITVSFFYSIIYLGILSLDVSFYAFSAEIITRAGYIILIGVGAGLMSREVLDQIDSKLQIEEAQKKLVKSESLLNDAQQIAHVGSWEWDLDTNVLSWSDELYRIYGYEPGEQAVNIQTFLAHIHPDENEKVLETISESIEQRKPFENHYRVLDRKGNEKTLLGLGKPMLDKDGKVSRVIGICYDITTQKQAEKELKDAHLKLEERVKERTVELKLANKMLRQEIKIRQEAEEKQKDLIVKLNITNEELKRINDDIDNFVYSASHDLKSPVLNIEALIALLFDEEEIQKNKMIAELKEKLEFSLTKMKKTIDNISSVAKSQKQAYDDVDYINLADIFQEVIKENQEVIKQSGAVIVSEFSAPETFACSRTCIKSILYNFLTNSIKYRHPDRLAKITFSAEFDEDHLYISAKDNGLGIDLERYAHKLFCIFKRFHDHVEGTGIGLYMVKRLVEKNRGTIDVSSIPGEGTTFTVTFPLHNEKILHPFLIENKRGI